MCTGEFFSAVVFSFLYLYHSVHPMNHFALLFALFFLLNFILLQASFYWFIKWKRIRTKRNVFPNLGNVLSVFKKINGVLLACFPIILILNILIGQLSPFQAFLAVFVYGFALIEYVNYYHIQLTNYKNGRGKKASILKELDKRKLLQN